MLIFAFFPQFNLQFSEIHCVPVDLLQINRFRAFDAVHLGAIQQLVVAQARLEHAAEFLVLVDGLVGVRTLSDLI